MVKKVRRCLFVLTAEFTNVTYTQTHTPLHIHRQTPHDDIGRACTCSIARQKSNQRRAQTLPHFSRDAMHKRCPCRRAVLSVCPAVCHVCVSRQNEYRVFNFSPRSSHTFYMYSCCRDDIDIAILSVCLSVRHVPVFYRNSLTYSHSFFTTR